MLARMLTTFLLLGLVAAAPAAKSPEGLKRYEGRYYVINTDLVGDDLREADLRMTKMAEEYKKRTEGFSGTIGHKFPFFLFRDINDYHAAGGMDGTAGVFNPNTDTLMAFAGEKTTGYTWNVIQHEGFHQFARSVIGGELPIWVNEGMAEYFGEGIFTGDGFITGYVPPKRLAHLKQQFEGRKFKSIKNMMLLDHARWNREMSQENYDQAWSMVQFLAHAENGKYQGAFVRFMRAIATGQQWDAAWLNSFGSAEGFEKQWKDYWLKMDDDPTADLYARAVTETITGVLGRAVAQKQKFESYDQLLAAVKANEVKIDNRDWLPPRLITSAFGRALKMQEQGAKFDLLPAQASRPQMILCTLGDGTKVTGKFSIAGGRVAKVTTESPARR
ncbi:MAG: hypothetical protein QOF78_1074 [Phycisphaerales bacterium]|nr:hypothetical protein [Phycisphaerales bacterium]